MARKVNGQRVEVHEVEWGFEFDSDETGEPTVIELDSEAEAQFYASFMDGNIVCRDVYVTEWALAPDK